MEIEIIDPKTPATTKDIASLEKDLGSALPDDYKNFLLAFNGGYPKRDRFNYKLQDREFRSIVDRFLSLSDCKFNNMRSYINTYSGRIPRGFLPIAHDPGGNLICLALNSDNFGYIYFWDHESEAEEDDAATFDNVALVANSFTDFLEHLKSIDR